MNSFIVIQNKTAFDRFFEKFGLFFSQHTERIIFVLSLLGAIIATCISYFHGWILAYGDAESHIDISKSIVNGLTPGFAQIGGIWLPLTHLLMVPLVYFNPLWRTGLAGSIISGIFYITACVYIFKLTKLITDNLFASFISFIVFGTNLNILYMQSTPMTEIPLIAFFVLSTYYYVKYLYKINSIPSLLLAGFFALCASLTRYDGWFLVLFEAIFIIFPGIFNRNNFAKKQGDAILFITLAAFGIIGWMVWCWAIFGNPLYFDTSVYSAKSQQLAWLQRNELPGYHNLLISLIYYVYASLANSGLIIFLLAFAGAIVFITSKSSKSPLAVLTILFVPFIFNVLSLFLGQSVIFIPSLTPKDFEYHLFNVRYGIMMIPFMAVFFGYLVSRVHISVKVLLIGMLIMQSAIFFSGISPVITLADGTQGLSAEKVPENVEEFINKNYDGGLVLLDNQARTISITQSTMPMENIIYVGNKPYWDISLKHPEKYAKWIIMQKNDAVWTALYDNETVRGDLYKYFKKVYTSPNILIFERNTDKD